MCSENQKGGVVHRRRFTPEEDELLKKLAKDITNKTWRDIAKHLPGRTATQCRDRYNQYLFQQVVSKPWTSEEDRIIVEKYKQFGSHWAKIAEYLPGRSGSNIKNRWNGALGRFHGIPHKTSKIERRQPRSILNALNQQEDSSSDFEAPKLEDVNVIFDQIAESILQQGEETFEIFDSFEEVLM